MQPDVLLEIKADALEVKPCGVEIEAGISFHCYFCSRFSSIASKKLAEYAYVSIRPLNRESKLLQSSVRYTVLTRL